MAKVQVAVATRNRKRLQRLLGKESCVSTESVGFHSYLSELQTNIYREKRPTRNEAKSKCSYVYFNDTIVGICEDLKSKFDRLSVEDDIAQHRGYILDKFNERTVAFFADYGEKTWADKILKFRNKKLDKYIKTKK